ncbi:MAG TPA: glycosyltransferase family 4 protein [Verrucomicrobiae bacterium]|nr:glycosyltransferase family 4 protein [Verrucomicrobiae bacterium]
MKIAVWHNLPSGGGKRALYDQVRGLVSRGHRVEAWCPPTASQDFLPLSPLITEHVVPLAGVSAAPRNWIGRFRYRLDETGRRMKSMEDHCRICANEISSGGFDVLLVHPCLLFRASPMAKFSRLPNILYLAEPYRALYEALPRLPWAAARREFRPFSPRYWKEFISDQLAVHNKRVQVREETAWVAGYDQVLVNSLFSRESLMRAYNVDSRVCYLGIDTETFCPTGAGKERFVIGLGNLDVNKRPALAVRAVAEIPLEDRPELIWVGNYAAPDPLQEVQKLARHLGVDFSLKMLIPDEALQDLLSRAAVMIYTSQLEPFGYAPLEANACGTGVVAVAEGGVRESLGNPASGILVPNASPQELAAALLKFTGDLGFAAEFGRAACAHVRDQWSQAKAMDRLEAELERLLKTPRTQGAPPHRILEACCAA